MSLLPMSEASYESPSGDGEGDECGAFGGVGGASGMVGMGRKIIVSAYKSEKSRHRQLLPNSAYRGIKLSKHAIQHFQR